MPRTLRERNAAAVNVDLGNVSVNIEQPTEGTKKARRWETADPQIDLPAGAYAVHIRHIDVNGGEYSVNTEPQTYGDIWEDEYRYNRTDNIEDYVPAITILNPQGVRMAIKVSYPSNHPFNPDAL